jgi:hypothetical protein
MILQDDIAKYFQSRAMECDRMAKMASSLAVADLYRKMEQRWLGAALRVEAASHATIASRAVDKLWTTSALIG